MYNVIEIKNLRKKFGEKKIFDNFTLEFRKNRKYAIKAPSGYGKSTLLNMIAGFLYPDEGEINIFGKLLSDENVSEIRSKICILPQLSSSFVNISVYDLIQKPFSFAVNQEYVPEDKEIEDLIVRCGLDKKITDENFGKLSGGEKQRVLLIMCKLLRREILLLDEPTSALDKVSTDIITEMLFDDDVTVIAASHDKNYLDRCDYIVDLKELKNGAN